MINTLKITSIVAGCLAILFFAMSAFLGLKPDEQKAGIVAEAEKFGQEKLRAEAAPTGDRADSPLVKQAQALALKLNPPRPVETVNIEKFRPVAVARFKLIGTFYYPENIGRSMLLDVPGKGQRWFKINDSVEGAMILKIFDGKIVYKEGDKVKEMSAGNKPATSVVEDSSDRTLIPTKEKAREMKEAAAFLKDLSDKKEEMTSEEAAGLGELDEFIKQVEAEANDIEASAESDANAVDQSDGVDANTEAAAEPDADAAGQEDTNIAEQDNNDVAGQHVGTGEEVGAPGAKE